jgi:hypothetical protein
MVDYLMFTNHDMNHNELVIVIVISQLCLVIVFSLSYSVISYRHRQFIDYRL